MADGLWLPPPEALTRSCAAVAADELAARIRVYEGRPPGVTEDPLPVREGDDHLEEPAHEYACVGAKGSLMLPSR